MAKQLELEVQKRNVLGKAARHLSHEGLIPANIYGHKEESVAVQVDAIAFDRLLRAHGTRSVLSLNVAGRIENVLVRHVQRNSVSGKIVHIDFTRVSMSDRIAVKAPLKFVGDAPGVKVHGGTFLQLADTLDIECRASDIVESLDVDISLLTEINSVLHAKDVKLPEGFSLVTDAEETIAKIDAPRGQVAQETSAEAAPATENSKS